MALMRSLPQRPQRPGEHPSREIEPGRVGELDARLLDELIATAFSGDILNNQIALVGAIAVLYKREVRRLREIRDALIEGE
jgi:hypothetical protein